MAYGRESGELQAVTLGSSNLHQELHAIAQLATVTESPVIPNTLNFME